MSTEDTSAFDVRVRDDGVIEISGEWAAHTLMRIALTAKFQTEPSAEMLLSPYTRMLIDALMPVAPYPPAMEWADPGILTPPAFLEVVEEVRQFQVLHRPTAALNDLVEEALHPYQVPLERLGLAK